MDKDGLTKLIEECGELVQIAAKKSAFMENVYHPDDKGRIDRRLENEIGDTVAAITFVIKKFQLNIDRINSRITKKLGAFEKWDK